MNIIYFLIIGFLLTACNTVNSIGGQPNIRNHQQNTVSTAHPRARLVAASKKLVGQIDLVNVRFGTAGQLQRAEVSVQNLSDKRYSLEYMYVWEDQQGFKINQNTVWKRFTLEPRAIESFQTIGVTPAAYGLTLTVRLPDDFFIHQYKTDPDRK